VGKRRHAECACACRQSRVDRADSFRAIRPRTSNGRDGRCGKRACDLRLDYAVAILLPQLESRSTCPRGLARSDERDNTSRSGDALMTVESFSRDFHRCLHNSRDGKRRDLEPEQTSDSCGFISRFSITSSRAFRSFRAGTDARLFMRLCTLSKLGRFPYNGESERVT